MAEAANHVQQEYWRAPEQSAGPVEGAAGLRRQLVCQQCGTEFIVGARFCHVCGSQREALVGYSQSRWAQVLDFGRIREALGLNAASLVAFAAGIACVIAAIATGFMFTAGTVLDWQAVQIWRVEWLLGAAAAFLAGILLKKVDVQ